MDLYTEKTPKRRTNLFDSYKPNPAWFIKVPNPALILERINRPNCAKISFEQAVFLILGGDPENVEFPDDEGNLPVPFENPCNKKWWKNAAQHVFTHCGIDEDAGYARPALDMVVSVLSRIMKCFFNTIVAVLKAADGVKKQPVYEGLPYNYFYGNPAETFTIDYLPSGPDKKLEFAVQVISRQFIWKKATTVFHDHFTCVCTDEEKEATQLFETKDDTFLSAAFLEQKLFQIYFLDHLNPCWYGSCTNKPNSWQVLLPKYTGYETAGAEVTVELKYPYIEPLKLSKPYTKDLLYGELRSNGQFKKDILVDTVHICKMVRMLKQVWRIHRCIGHTIVYQGNTKLLGAKCSTFAMMRRVVYLLVVEEMVRFYRDRNQYTYPSMRLTEVFKRELQWLKKRMAPFKAYAADPDKYRTMLAMAEEDLFK